MLETCAFWALLWLPGFALVRALAPAELERGLLSAVALGYAASFTLLMPVSLLCYALALPAWVMSAATALCITLGLVAWLRKQAWHTLVQLFRRESPLALLLLVALLVLAGRAGGWLDGDATFHLGRIRDLLDHGFSNHDIYLEQPYFAYAYHTNLLHAVYAAAVQLTRADPLVVWYASLPWAKLVIAGGHYHLAHVLCRKPWAAWLVAIAVSVMCAGETYAIYPNLLAVGWLLPLVLAIGFEAHEVDAGVGNGARDDASKRAPLATLLKRVDGRVAGLVLGCMLLVQVHALYWVFALLALAPLLLVHALLVLRRSPHRARLLASCLVALLAGAPWAWVARYGGQPSPAQTAAALAAARALPVVPQPEKSSAADTSTSAAANEGVAQQGGGGHLEKQLVRGPDGRRALPLSSAGGLALLIGGLLALAVALWRPVPLQPRMLALAAALLPCLALPLVPALCELPVALGLPDFGVARLITIADSLLVVAIAAALAPLLDRLRPSWLVHNAALAAAILAASVLPGHAPRTFREYFVDTLADEAHRHSQLDLQRARRALLDAYVPAGETVLATLRDARYVVMLRDLRVIAVDRGHGLVPDITQRRSHVELMTQARLPWPMRVQFLQHYRVHYVIYRDKHHARFAWAREHGKTLGRAGGWQLVRVEVPAAR
jgi:hypothetical protein